MYGGAGASRFLGAPSVQKNKSCGFLGAPSVQKNKSFGFFGRGLVLLRKSELWGGSSLIIMWGGAIIDSRGPRLSTRAWHFTGYLSYL